MNFTIKLFSIFLFNFLILVSCINNENNNTPTPSTNTNPTEVLEEKKPPKVSIPKLSLKDIDKQYNLIEGSSEYRSEKKQYIDTNLSFLKIYFEAFYENEKDKLVKLKVIFNAERPNNGGKFREVTCYYLKDDNLILETYEADEKGKVYYGTKIYYHSSSIIDAVEKGPIDPRDFAKADFLPHSEFGNNIDFFEIGQQKIYEQYINYFKKSKTVVD
jgi:hypothetical protein